MLSECLACQMSAVDPFTHSIMKVSELFEVKVPPVGSKDFKYTFAFKLRRQDIGERDNVELRCMKLQSKF